MDASEELKVSDKKALSRTQRWAAWAYSLPFLFVVLPGCVVLLGALWRGDVATQLAVLDKHISFAQVYGLVAAGSVVGAGAVLKGARAFVQVVKK